MDLTFLQHPAVVATAAAVGLAGAVVQFLAYRQFKALKLKPSEPMPTPILTRFVLGGFVCMMALVVCLLPRA